MARVNEADLAALLEGVEADFQYGLLRAPTLYKEIATVVASTTQSTRYHWLDKFPLLRDWVGKRTFNGVVNQGYHLSSQPLTATVTVSGCESRDSFRTQFQQLGTKAGDLPNELVFKALSGGFWHRCYDLCNFFDHAHPIYANHDGTGAVTLVSNLYQEQGFTGDTFYLLDCSHAIKPIILQNHTPAHLVANKGEVPSIAVAGGYQLGYSFWQFAYAVKGELTLDNILQAITAMRALPRDGNEPLVINPTHLVIPTSLAKRAIKLTGATSEDNNLTLITPKGRLTLLIIDCL